MKKDFRTRCAACSCTDWALLFLRLFIGGMLVMHNIGKLQTYNAIIDTYPAFPGLGRAATFVAVSLAECICAAMIMTGFMLRTAACIMAGVAAAASAAAMGTSAVGPAGEWFLYAGIYVFLLLAGGGRLGFDPVRTK